MKIKFILLAFIALFTSGVEAKKIGDNILLLGNGDAANPTDVTFRFNNGETSNFNEIFLDEASGKIKKREAGVVSDISTSGPPDVSVIENLGLDSSIGASALTIDLKQADGSTDPTAALPVNINFRNSTLTSGGTNLISASAALTIVIPSGATLGTIDTVKSRIYIYAIDNAGTVELAVGNFKISASEDVVSTTILDSSSDASNVLYSTVARSNVPVRILGVIESVQSTAGTWDTGHTLLSVGDHVREVRFSCRIDNNGSASINDESGLCDQWVLSVNRVSIGLVDLTFITTIFFRIPVCHLNILDDTASVRFPQFRTVTNLVARFMTIDISNGGQDENVFITCTGIR